jgi:branched-chain amino acid aminotransferase
MQATDSIWMNSRLVKWEEATVHVASHGLPYGSGVFEGVRAYETAGGSSIFRLTDHLRRLRDSARLLRPRAAARGNRARRCERARRVLPAADRLLRFRRARRLAAGEPVDVAIISWPWGAYLGEEGQTTGIRAKISSWQRVGPNVIPHTAKATGIYINSMLAVNEALDGGYDEAILLTSDGYVADGSG